MDDPVLIGSGVTYERAIIEREFEIKRSRLETKREESDFDESTYFRCPLTSQPVNPDVIIPNKRIKKATEDFIEKNPWAYDFDPRQDFHQIKVWQ
mmetsp:Transcript_29609/g.39383  ORF Transcript_29609/g.39383 Transcript_29609/m.39383 type:complete len:95 (+) Transcript_29609:1008-1292(+)